MKTFGVRLEADSPGKEFDLYGMKIPGSKTRVSFPAGLEKLSEAEYFLSRMKTCSNNPSVFPYYVSAFLSAFYSVQDHVQHIYNEYKIFKEPIREKLKAFQTKKIIRELNNLRTTEIHRKPLELEYEVSLKPISLIRTSSAHIGFEFGRDGFLKGVYSVDDGEQKECPVRVGWVFSSNAESDVISICDEGFSQLRILVSDVKQIMGS